MAANKFFNKSGIILILILSTILYLKIFKGFFQQDEWYSFSWYVLHSNLSFLDSIKFFFYPSISHYNPFTVAVQQFLFSRWGLNYIDFAMLGLILHLLVIFLFFHLANKIFNNKLQALLAVLIFSSMAAGFQAVTWVVTDIATLCASGLAIISFLFYFNFLQKNEGRKLFFSMLFLLFSLLFKEISIGLLPLYLVTYLLEKKGKQNKNKKYLISIIIFAFTYFAFRLAMIFVPPISNDGAVTQYLSLSTIIYDFLTIPFKSITYVFIQPDFFKSVMLHLTALFPVNVRGIAGTTAFEEFAVKVLMETGSIFIGVVVATTSIAFALNSKKNKIRFSILFGISWAVLNSLIFSLSPGTSGAIQIPDSRNLYFLSMGIAIFLACFNKKKIFLILFIILNIFWLKSNVDNFVAVASTRKHILSQIKNDYPKLPSKVIFFIESDSSFYGLPENIHILPFQSGFGQTLLSWYEKDQNFPNDFFKNNYLWDIESQGYKEINSVGFGYFRNFNDLKTAIKQNKFDVDNVIGYSYNSKNQVLINITSDLNKRLKSNEKK